MEQIKPANPSALVNFFCEKLHCWMMNTVTCENRKRRALTGRYEHRAKYLATGCGTCSLFETKKGKIHIMNDATEDTKKEKKCKGPCGRVLPMDAFNKNPNTLDGREGKCKDCRKEMDKARHARNKAEKEQKTAPKAVKKKTLPEDIKPDIARVAVFGHPEISDIQVTPNVTPNVITLDFSHYPDIFKTIQDLAETEFRPVDMQVLYMLKQQINQSVDGPIGV